MGVERKGGGARRGPFANKREPFATRLTSDTMASLTKAADREGLSISQKAEELLVLGLKTEDAYERELGPLVEAFRSRAILAIARANGRGPANDDEVLRDVTVAAQTLLASLATLRQEQYADTATAPAAVTPPARRRGRLLSVDDDT